MFGLVVLHKVNWVKKISMVEYVGVVEINTSAKCVSRKSAK